MGIVNHISLYQKNMSGKIVFSKLCACLCVLKLPCPQDFNSGHLKSSILQILIQNASLDGFCGRHGSELKSRVGAAIKHSNFFDVRLGIILFKTI